MIDERFDLENFNVISDDEYYYFFRALEEVDLESIENKKILDENGNIIRLMTDREYYGEQDKFHADSEISLDEIYNHIKMHYNRHTNCISFTSNANTVLTYGRQTYDDKYVVLKVKKEDFGKDSILAAPYMMREIEKNIRELRTSDKLDDLQKFYIDAIDRATTYEELERIKLSLPKEYENKTRELFENGIESESDINYRDISIMDSGRYQTLDDEQNFIKDKLVLMTDVVADNIIPSVSNKFLVQTVGLAFSSQEIIHYKDVPGEELISVSKEMMDVFSLVQQMPKEDPLVIDLKKDLIEYMTNNPNTTLHGFDKEEEYIDRDLSIDSMYELTDGSIPYGEASKLYKKAFYIAKSKLRCLNTCKIISDITNNNPKYVDLIEKMKDSCYGIEADISTRLSNKGLQLSEGVSMTVNTKDIELVNRLSKLDEQRLRYILDNPLSVVQEFLLDTSYVNKTKMDKPTYFANAIIDLNNWEKLGIKINLSPNQREDIVRKLKETNFIEVYYQLKERLVNDKRILESQLDHILLTALIKNKDMNDIDIKDTFSITQLEEFIGYNKLKGTELKLRNYQATALSNIDRTFEDKKYTTAVLPTGAGKSFVALSEMYEHRNETENEGILFLAPNVEILNQLKGYIWQFYADKNLYETEDQIIERVFPGLKLSTYKYLESDNAEDLINQSYNLIVCDELHRTGATVTNKNLDRLFKNQSDNTKILGLTATPLRDADLKQMANYWARYFDYTEDEITLNKHLSVNLDLKEAIENGYVIHPKVVNCAYNLLNDGHMESLLDKIDNAVDSEEKRYLLGKYNNLRRRLEQAQGVDQILNDNIKPGGKYIVFCPVRNEYNEIIDDEGNLNESIDSITAVTNITKYMDDLKGELSLFAKEHNLDFDKDIEITSMLGCYSAKDNNDNIRNFNATDKNKTKFLVVMNKLNEGVHVDDIDGIIWKRPLSGNSRILFYQQLGRCIYGLDPTKEYSDEDRPIVIDLVNNTLNVNLDKNIPSLEEYLNKINFIYSWSLDNNKIPDLNSYDTEESKLGNNLKKIQEKFSMYIDNDDLFKTLTPQDILIIKEIIKVGSKMDLWTYDFDPREKLTIEEKLDKYITMLNGNYEPEPFDELTNFIDTSVQINGFLMHNLDLQVVPKLFFELKEESKYENARNKILKYLNVSNIEEYLNKDDNELFELRGLLRDFYELEKEAKELNGVPIEERLEEIKEIVDNLEDEKKRGKVPVDGDKIRFKDDSSYIGPWIHKNKERIIELSETNEIARWICEEKKWLYSFEDRLEEIKKLGYIPKSEDKVRFKDGSAYIEIWIGTNKKRIIELSETNETARWICEEKKWLYSFEERLEEIKKIVDNLEDEKKRGKVPLYDDEIRFKDGSALIGYWIYEKKERIIELSETNEIARWICMGKGWLSTIDNRLEEIKELGYIPKSEDKEKFKDGSALIGKWIHKNKERIIELSKTNEIARWICEEKGWIYLLEYKYKKNKTIEERLKEIKEIVDNLEDENKRGKVPSNVDRIRFKDKPTLIGKWITKNKDIIIELSKTNEIARWICEEKGWFVQKENKTIEERLEEIKEIVDNLDDEKNRRKILLDGANNKTRFSDGSAFIGKWINKHKEKIIELSETNEIARWICEEKGWINIISEENKLIKKLKEIKEIVDNLDDEKKRGKVPVDDDKIRFSDGSAFIGKWISQNKEKIIELSETNEIARWICEEKEWILKEDAIITKKNKMNLEKQLLGELRKILESNNISDKDELSKEQLDKIEEDFKKSI